MTKKTLGFCLLLILILGVFFAIGNSKKIGVTSEKEVLGVIVPLSGPAGSMGEFVKNAIDLADAKHVTIEYQDDQCDGKKALSSYQELKLKGAKIFYVACSGSVLALAPLAKNDGNLIITAYAGSAEIRKTGDEVIRFIPDALTIVDAMKEYFKENTANTTYAILYEEQDYPKSVADGVVAALGSKLLIKETYRPDSTDMRSQLTKIKGKNVDKLVFVPVSDATAKIALGQMRDLGLKTTVVGDVNLCGYPFSPSDFGQKTVCWNAELDKKEANIFADIYKAKYASTSTYPFYDAITYDSIGIVDDLVGSAGSKKDLIPYLKSHILGGIKGKISSYEFEPNGEVMGVNYLKMVEK